jgi:hypothetical protein
MCGSGLHRLTINHDPLPDFQIDEAPDPVAVIPHFGTVLRKDSLHNV